MPKGKRDNINRKLRPNERQRSDGLYEFRYSDNNGKRHSVYSWKLVDTDKGRKGKEEKSLRAIERQIERDREDRISTVDAKRLKLNDFYKKNMKTRRLKPSTRENYTYMYTKFVKPVLGSTPIADITYSDIKELYYDLIEIKKIKPNSIEIIHTILHPIFTTAVRDGYIRINPSDGVMGEIKRGRDWERPKRKALTERQQEAFISYIAGHKTYRHWLYVFTFLLGTGCRIGEAVGLRWDDCDFEEGIIHINHNLIYRKNMEGSCRFQVTTPKTQAGIREIPMFDEVKKTLLEEKERQTKQHYKQIKIDGYCNFIFRNRFGELLSPHCINRAIDRIIKDYNNDEECQANKEGRMPELLPHFSCHHLRHTFCTRMCENTSDTNTLKVIQEIMGHSDLATTLDVYTDLTRGKKQSAFHELQGKIKLA